VSSDDGGYVHDPEAFRERDGDDPDEGPGTSSVATPAESSSASTDEDLGAAGWVLVAVLVVCLLVIPAVVLIRPPALPWEVSLLVLPMLPGVVLGAVAVWTAVRDRQA